MPILRRKETIGTMEAQPISKERKLVTTAAILLGNLTLGCCLNMYSPSLEELRVKYDTSVDEISKVFSIALICYAAGSLTGGIVYTYINRQLGAIFCLSGLSLSILLSPHCPSTTVFFIIGGLLGFCSGGYDTAQVVWVIEMWQSEAGPYIQAQHLCYALGCNLPGLLLAPFLSSNNEVHTALNNQSIFDNFENSTSGATNLSEILPLELEDIEPQGSRIYIPFSIASALNAVPVVFQIFLFTFFRYSKPPMEVEKSKNSFLDSEYESIPQIDSKTYKPKNESLINWPRLRLMTLATLFMAANVGMEMCSMQFTPTFAIHSDLKLSESDAAMVFSGLTGALAVGRFLGIFIVLKVPPELMLCGNLTLCLLANFIILIWANSNLVMLWTGCIMLGAGLSTIYGSYCGFIERHLIFNDAVGAAILVGGSCTAAIYPLIVGGFIEQNPVVFTYVNFFSISVCVVVLAIAYVITLKNKTRL